MASRPIATLLEVWTLPIEVRKSRSTVRVAATSVADSQIRVNLASGGTGMPAAHN